MKKIFISLLFMFSISAKGGNGVERGHIFINGAAELNPEIVSFLEKELERCTLGTQDDQFHVEKIVVEEDRVDNGIIDYNYTIDFQYKAVRNDQLTNHIQVKVLDSDYHNWKHYSEKLSLQISYDKHNFCK